MVEGGPDGCVVGVSVGASVTGAFVGLPGNGVGSLVGDADGAVLGANVG